MLFIFMGDKVKFKFFRFSIKVGLYLENPFCTNGSFAFWRVDELPSFVLLYGVDFKFHTLNLTKMFCSFIKVLGLLSYKE
jgi:hypothetical protein